MGLICLIEGYITTFREVFMKTVFLSLVLLVSTSAIAMDNQQPQQQQAPVVRTN
jgi:hypothetical protein